MKEEILSDAPLMLSVLRRSRIVGQLFLTLSYPTRILLPIRPNFGMPPESRDDSLHLALCGSIRAHFGLCFLIPAPSIGKYPVAHAEVFF